MEDVPAIFRNGTIKPLKDLKIREGEKVLLVILGHKNITEETYGVVEIGDHEEIERIIENTEYEV
ncbi:MAG TPA: DUF104 domain-containing protein [Methanosarcinales archaeon]|nr:DUF104 domain-containing protein [Methanosarcinales archaeon]